MYCKTYESDLLTILLQRAEHHLCQMEQRESARLKHPACEAAHMEILTLTASITWSSACSFPSSFHRANNRRSKEPRDTTPKPIVPMSFPERDSTKSSQARSVRFAVSLFRTLVRILSMQGDVTYERIRRQCNFV